MPVELLLGKKRTADEESSAEEEVDEELDEPVEVELK